MDPYLGVTIHYIDNPPDQPNEWELKADLLGLPKIEGNHGAANIAATLIDLFKGFGILEKVRVLPYYMLKILIKI